MGENHASREDVAFQAWLLALPAFDLPAVDFAHNAWNAGIAWHRQVIKHDLRITQLAKMTKVQLAVIAGNHDTVNDMLLLNEYSRWSKDELINRILDREYPEVRPRPPL